MWDIRLKKLTESVNQYEIVNDNQVMSYADWIDTIVENAEFATFFNTILSESSFQAFFWEVKPTDKSQLSSPFQFVLVNSSSLIKIDADKSSFQNHLNQNETVVAFENLGKDAVLIVPTPLVKESTYAHLATFTRSAPQNQIVDFWKRVGLEYKNKIGEQTKWLSTAGLGVYWLHVRVDSRPKYYRFNDYRLIT